MDTVETYDVILLRFNIRVRRVFLVFLFFYFFFLIFDTTCESRIIVQSRKSREFSPADHKL